MGTLWLPDLEALLPWLLGVTLGQWVSFAASALFAYTLWQYTYNAYFHPLAKYPGPAFASVSDLWSAYHLSAGKWPWVVENALKNYGDVVRIGPNSLVFMEPQAFLDIHGPKRDLNDTFIKTPMVDGLGDEDDGLLWERDPEKHRRVSKTMSPAFSGNSLRSKVPTMNKHIELMIQKLKEHGTSNEGTDLRTWLEWTCMDTAADLAYSWEIHQLRDMKTHRFLEALDAANFLVIISATAKTYPILIPLALLFVPWKVMRSMPRIISELRVRVEERVKMRYNLEHSDYFEQILPENKPAPKTKKQIGHMLTVTGQLILGGYDPTSVAVYMMFVFILQNPEALERLKHEVREGFTLYEDIDSERLRRMPWLNACLSETLRLSAAATHHALPRFSPGAIVDGEYIPKGVSSMWFLSSILVPFFMVAAQVLVRSSLFAYGRSDRFFHDPKSFRPERWLSEDHPDYSVVFSKDDHRAHYPFILGPRQCPGREVARIMFRLIVAKIVWLFDTKQVSETLDFDQDFRVYAMWKKPELRVQFVPVER